MEPRMIPLNPMDEMFIHLEDPTRPITIELAVRVKGRLDETRLREAVHSAVRRHPLTRARLKPVDSGDKTYFWIIDDELSIDPVSVIDCDSGGRTELDDVRSDFYSRAIPLSDSPPFRVLLVHHPDGDFVMLSVNHTAFDGISSLRLMQSIGRSYAGVPDPIVELDPGEALRLAKPQHGPGMSERIRDARLGVQQLAEMRSRPARIAAKDPSTEPGYSVHTLTLPVTPLTKSPLRRRLDATVNDMLLAAVHRSISKWNDVHGTAAGRIAISMPVNARHEDWRNDVIANIFTTETVSTTKSERATPETCLAAVAKWTAAVKSRGTGSGLAAQTKAWGGRVSQRRALGGVTRAIAGYLNGTGALSNLGRVERDWIGSRKFQVSEVWVSPPVVGTVLSVGAVSMNNVLHLSLRTRHTLLSSAALAAFGDVLRAELESLSRPASSVRPAAGSE